MGATPRPQARTLPQLRRFAAAFCLAACALASPVRAHPIVSTDINRHVTLRVTDERFEIRYIYELLEIAAIKTARAWDADGNGSTSDVERDAYAASLGKELSVHLRVTLDGTPVPLVLDALRWELGEGAMGLSTWKLIVRFTGRLPVAAPTGMLAYRDELQPAETGWKEVILMAGGLTGIARSSVPAHDRSYELTDYTAMAELPNPNQTTADALLRFGGALAPSPGVAEADNAAATKPPAVEPRPQRPRREPALAPSGSTSARAPAASAPEPAAAHPAREVSGFFAAWHRYAWPFFKLGVHHIATGYDHLLFLLGLLLFRQSLARLVVVITAFTLAHSITLGLAAAGWVTPPGALVELLIAASIAYVGAVTLLRPESRHGPWIALAFGLAHGFGFAGALSEALGPASGKGWLVALASFNLGIEAFQLLLVVVAWPLLIYVDRLKQAPAIRKALSAAVLAAGLLWIAARLA